MKEKKEGKKERKKEIERMETEELGISLFK